jgi:hypothetical protein
MKLSGRFDITNRAMGGVAALRSRKQWCGERLMAMLTTKSAALRLVLPQPFFADGSERLRNLGDRLNDAFGPMRPEHCRG